MTGGPSDYDRAITDGGLSPGDLLLIVIDITQDDKPSGGSGPALKINKVSLVPA